MYQVTDLHVWDLTSSSTRYEHSVALPSSSTIWTGMTVYATISVVVSTVLFIQLLSIWTNATVRSKAFNLYLMFLVLPDFIFSGACGITCAWNAVATTIRSQSLCEWQSSYTVFGFAGSAWMNAVIARQLHVMIRYSYGRPIHSPHGAPSVYAGRGRVRLECLCGIVDVDARFFAASHRPLQGYGVFTRTTANRRGRTLFLARFLSRHDGHSL